MQVDGAKILVTGANRGIGLALAKRFARAGAHVLIGVRDDAAADAASALSAVQAQAASGREVRLFKVDLGRRESVADAVARLDGEAIDILVNNAGLLTGGRLESQPVDDVYAMFQVNLLGLVQLTQGVLPGMIRRGRGKIVNNASVSGVMNFPLASTYSAAKTGVVAFTRCLQNELRGVVSTLVLLTPGVKTRMFDAIPEKYGSDLEMKYFSQSITAEEWAENVLAAILDDRDVLIPGGGTRVGVWLARYAPGLFDSLVSTQFRRR